MVKLICGCAVVLKAIWAPKTKVGLDERRIRVKCIWVKPFLRLRSALDRCAINNSSRWSRQVWKRRKFQTIRAGYTSISSITRLVRRALILLVESYLRFWCPNRFHYYCTHNFVFPPRLIFSPNRYNNHSSLWESTISCTIMIMHIAKTVSHRN